MILRPKSAMRDYQVEGLTHIYERDRSLIFSRPGSGKTVVALTAADELLRDGVVKRVLVSPPLRVAELIWHTEAAQWEHLKHLKIALAVGDREERDAACESDAEIVVTNHENLLDLLEIWPDAGFDMLIIDELSKFKGPTGKRWKRLVNNTYGFTVKVGLTGSPAPNEIADLFGAVRVIDEGKSMGISWNKWRNENMQPQSFVAPVPLWVPTAKTFDTIMDAIEPITYVLQDTNWKPPPVRHIPVLVDLPREIRSLYDELMENMTVEIDEDILLPGGKAQVQGKLLQLCAGFYYTFKDGEQVGRRLHPFRIDAIEDIVTRQGANPVFIVYDYVEQLKELKRRWPKAPVLGKGTSRKGAQDAYRRWNDGELPVMIGHPASMGHGLNLQTGGHITAWCSRPWNLDHFEQVNLRFARSGQTAAETLSYETEARNTIEQDVHATLGFKAKVQDSVFRKR